MQQAIMLAQGAATGGGGTVVTWDAAKKSAEAVLSGGALTLKTSNGVAAALSTLGHTTGKRYFEVVCDVSESSQICVGIARAGGTTNLSTDVGQEAGEYGWHGSGNSYFAGSFGALSGGAIATGTVVGIAVDFTNRRLWISINGAWVVGNPATGTTPAVTYASGLGTIFAATSVVSPNDQITARFNSGFSYAIPTGFSAWGA